MKFVILAAVASVALAAPQYNYNAPSRHSSEERDFVPILKDERVHEEDGTYNVDVETGNGIVLAQSGAPAGPDGSVVKSGQYSYTAPDGTPVVVKFVADENGYQAQSNLLPVAPAFPHPIPQFVLDQIAKAAREDAARARGDFDSSEEYGYAPPSSSYGAPQ